MNTTEQDRFAFSLGGAGPLSSTDFTRRPSHHSFLQEPNVPSGYFQMKCDSLNASWDRPGSRMRKVKSVPKDLGELHLQMCGCYSSRFPPFVKATEILVQPCSQGLPRGAPQNHGLWKPTAFSPRLLPSCTS